jgi:Ca2+-binding RTX toxin-like protein
LRALIASVIVVALVGTFGSVSQAAVPTCRFETPTIVGTPGNDILKGTPEHDVIVGLEGNDVIHGGGGADLICGNQGSDTIYGDIGPDNLLGNNGNDTIHSGMDQNNGDLIDGGPGDDILDGGSRAIDRSDLVTYELAPGPVNVNLVTGVATGYGTDSLSGIESVIGSPHADTIVGTSGVLPQDLLGGRGNDYIKLTGNVSGAAIKITPGVVIDARVNGDDGPDIYIGTNGDDSMEVRDSQGSDTLYARGGNDSLHMTDGLPGDLIDGQGGTDSCTVDMSDFTVDCESTPPS